MALRPLDTLIYLSLRLLKALDRRPASIEAFAPGAARNILIISSTAIGDTLLSTPAIRAVRKAYPRAHIAALFNNANMELFANSPYIDRAVPYYGGWKRFYATAKALRAFKPGLALIFHGNEPQATPLAWLSGARFIFKLPNDSAFNFLLSNRTPVLGWKDLGHGIEARLMTAALAGCKTNDLRMELFVDKETGAAAEGFLHANGLSKDGIAIGFQPGASTISRQWFPDRYIELGKRLLAAHPSAKIILTGSPQEAGLCEGIAKGIGNGVIVTAGRLPLAQLPPLIRRLQCLVTGDTGPMHVAITAGAPVVALYAVADARKTGPLYDTDRHVVIQKPRACEPCVSKKCAYQRCMEAITVDEVSAAVETIISRLGRG
ncbi:MAG: glycosyltransferase family 9 protein [Deltaproteobacteria bacterium]|nr:glycosyltransferase family 9 protein [Deltaproteobacteria bacterium]